MTLPAIEVRLGRAQARRGDTAVAASHLDAAIGALDQQNAASGPVNGPLLAEALVERAAVAQRAHELGPEIWKLVAW